MAAKDSAEHGPTSLINALTKALECEICMEDQKELRTLTCCQMLACLTCIERLFVEETKNPTHGGTPVCPTCQRPLTKKPEQYPVNKMAQHLQRYAASFKRELGKDSKSLCQSEGCDGRVDFSCKTCKKFLCYRCKSMPCQNDNDEHDAVDVRDCVTSSKETLHLWKTAKEEEIQSLKEKREKLCQEIRAHCQQMIDSSHDQLAKNMAEAIPLLTAAQKPLDDINDNIIKEESALKVVIETAERVCETELVYIVTQLNTYEESRKIHIGEFEALLEGKVCYDVAVSRKGDVLVARDGGLDILSADTSKVLKSLPFDGLRCATVEAYDTTVIFSVTCSRPVKKSIFVTLDNDYEEIARWSILYDAHDFTTVDNKLFMTLGSDQRSSDIKVSSLEGDELPSIPWNGCVMGIAGIAPHSIIYSDLNQHRVYKQRITSNKRGFEWKVDAKAPFSLCVDSTGLIWVRSNKNDCLTILNRDGTRHQDEIMDEKFTKLGEIYGLTVHDGYLYVAHDNGAGRFLLIYE